MSTETLSLEPVGSQLKCTKLETNNCFSITLSYNETSLMPETRCKNISEVKEKLNLWKELKAVPVCWKVLEAFLCQFYLPKCENKSVRLPCTSFCLRAQEACSMIPKFNKGSWPHVLDCERFPSTKCDEFTRVSIIIIKTEQTNP